MIKHKADVVVLGAGPAGSIAARELGRAGVDVIMIDGGGAEGGHAVESLPPSGAPLAEEIGLLDAICEISNGPAERMHMHWRDTPETRMFDGAGPLLLARAALHGMLSSEARAAVRHLQDRARKIIQTEKGVEIVTDDASVTCDVIVDARGRQARKRAASDLVALPFSLNVAVPDHMMWLEAQSDGWLWACSLEGGAVHGALFQATHVLSGLSATARLEYARGCLSLSNAFRTHDGLQVARPTAAGFSAVDDPVPMPRHILIGDAAIARDPIASHGLVHAMRSAVQAAVAVRTILDPSTDSHAAFRFLRHKHAEAVATAQQATARAYRDQTRFRGAFWAEHAKQAEPDPDMPLTEGTVRLASPLTRAPVLASDRIRWAPAIALPARHDFFTGLGPVTALDVAAACRPSASLQDIANRLGRSHAMPVVFDVLEHLALGGAFAQDAAAP